MLGRVTLSGIYHGTPNRTACGSSRIYSVFGAPSQRDFYGHGLFYFRDSFDLDSIDVLQRNYYDTYDSLPDAFPDLVYDEDPQYGKCYINSTASTGLLTATVVRVPDGDKGHEQYTRFYYDRDRNLIQSRQLSLAGRLIVHKTSFDFSGQPLSSCEEYDGHVGLSKRFYYDHVGRLVRELHVIDSDTTRFLYDYDGVGRNIRLTRVHGSDSLRMDYQYNLRGWLTSVASPFFSQVTSCWVMVLPPRTIFLLSFKYRTAAFPVDSKSTPSCSQNRLSSMATTALIKSTGISWYLT